MWINKILIISLFILSTNSFYGSTYMHPNINYNKGLEYYQQENLGKAMFFTKRAILLKPQDANIRTLFYKIRQDIGLPPIYSQDRFDQKIFAYIFAQITPQISAFVGALLFIIGSIIVSFIILKKYVLYHKMFIPFIWGCFSLSILLFSQSLILYYGYFAPDQRILLQSSIAYEEPSENSIQLLQLPAGTEIIVIDQTEEFLLVKTLDGKQYWLTAQNIPKIWEEI